MVMLRTRAKPFLLTNVTLLQLWLGILQDGQPLMGIVRGPRARPRTIQARIGRSLPVARHSPDGSELSLGEDRQADGRSPGRIGSALQRHLAGSGFRAILLLDAGRLSGERSWRERLL